jgi:hypothetical protein
MASLAQKSMVLYQIQNIAALLFEAFAFELFDAGVPSLWQVVRDGEMVDLLEAVVAVSSSFFCFCSCC